MTFFHLAWASVLTYFHFTKICVSRQTLLYFNYIFKSLYRQWVKTNLGYISQMFGNGLNIYYVWLEVTRRNLWILKFRSKYVTFITIKVNYKNTSERLQPLNKIHPSFIGETNKVCSQYYCNIHSTVCPEQFMLCSCIRWFKITTKSVLCRIPQRTRCV